MLSFFCIVDGRSGHGEERGSRGHSFHGVQLLLGYRLGWHSSTATEGIRIIFASISFRPYNPTNPMKDESFQEKVGDPAVRLAYPVIPGFDRYPGSHTRN